MKTPYESSANFSLPSIIDTPYPVVAINDLYEVGQSFAPDITQEEADGFEAELTTIRKGCQPIESTYYQVSAAELAASLEQRAAAEVAKEDQRVGVVYLDRYVGREQTGSQYTRLEVSRNPQNELTARTGCILTPQQQLEQLAQWAAERQFDELLFVDDVVAFGDTFPTLVHKLRTDLPDVNFRLLVGIAASGGIWRGIEKIKEECDIAVECLTNVIASPPVPMSTKGMNIPVARDLTVFGGKVRQLPGGEAVSFPYFLPFSKPLLSLIGKDHFLNSAEQLFAFNEHFLEWLEEKRGEEIQIGDLLDRSYGVPFTSLESLQDIMRVPDRRMSVRDHLVNAHTLLHNHVDLILEEVTHP